MARFEIVFFVFSTIIYLNGVESLLVSTTPSIFNLGQTGPEVSAVPLASTEPVLGIPNWPNLAGSYHHINRKSKEVRHLVKFALKQYEKKKLEVALNNFFVAK